MQRRRYESDDDDDDDDDDEDDDDEDDDDEDDDESDDEHMGHAEKEHRRRRRRRRRRGEEDDNEDEDDDDDSEDLDGEDEEMEDMDEEGEEEEEEEDEDEDDTQTDSEPEPPVLLVSDLNDELLNGSYLTVTLQRPTKARRDPGSIVPKLEAAVSSRAPSASSPGPGFVQRKTLQKGRHKNGSAVPTGNGLTQPKGTALTPGRHARHGSSNHRHHHHRDGERDTASPSSTASSRSSASPTPPPHSSSTSPPSLLSHPSFREVGNEPGGEKEVWVSVFRYLTRTELSVCMTVCKAWYKWGCDKRLWTRIDLSRCGSLTPQALSGIIKRQPVTLDLSWTPISKKQLSWLIHRMPGLKDLMVAGCSWLSVSALSSSSCPYLRTLDLRWAEGVRDGQIKDLVTPQGSESRSRLRGMQTLRLSGLDITDSTLRLLLRHMPLLQRLDLAHCRAITDQSINLLTATGSPTRHTLIELNLAGCHKLTDACLQFLKRTSALQLLDLRGCKGVTRRACEGFISDLSYCTYFCMTDDKLIQRIS